MKNVTLSECLEGYQKRAISYKIPVMFGVSKNGEHVFSDLVDLKHLVIAGETGSGKSVFVHSLICSLLTLVPNDVKFLLSDAKKVELTPYNGIPQLLGQVILKPEEFFIKLEELVEEKDRRLALKNNNYPYIIAIFETISDMVYFDPLRFDKLMGDLLKDADKAKIHVVVVDSRVCPQVFTPTIMSLMPTKLCFATSDAESSKYIIGNEDGVNLNGQGDLLMLKDDGAKPMRLQIPWVDEKEVKKMVEIQKKN